MLTPSATFDLRSQARLVALSLRACLMGAGVLPWFLAVGYVAAAAAQEPLLLRSFGIQLVPQTAQCVGGVIALVLSSQLRLVRSPVTQVVTTAMVTTLVAAVLAGCLFGIELARKGPFPSSAHLGSAPDFIITFFPAALCMSLVDRGRSWIRNAHVVVQVVFAVATSVRSSGHNWSFDQGLATMACSASAVVATVYYCKQKT